ncbi:hypothetical protein IscW_ISCW014703 [Ixodes scapularis]|uniref:Uncharacterized protein n=1 Tax=Ixodes scapularis TaxID=6945 RepID=B7QLK9_IXOSC|nr:hypothetical protein IscW_ISCW014703 [Ixodes scapularis]|eukprot:XP_002416065.1 hypothetical protein IscW_ISCW014703 [Ixodes scapularis]
MGIESQEPPSSPFSVGGLFTKIRSYIPTRKGGTDGGQGQAHDAMAEVDGTRDQLMESQVTVDTIVFYWHVLCFIWAYCSNEESSGF